MKKVGGKSVVLTHQTQNSEGNYTYSAIFYESSSWEYHFHKNYELIYVIEGRVECVVWDRKAVLERDDFALCLPNEIHSITSLGQTKIWICVFSADFVTAFDKIVQGKQGENFKFRCNPAVLSYVKERLIIDEPQNLLRMKAELYAVCDEFLSATQLISRKEKHTNLMNVISDYVAVNYGQKLTLSMLAENLGYNYCYFSKAFHKLFKMSFNSYVNTYRFSKACELLVESDMSITDIALESGFQSIRSFNEVFCRMAGVSPIKYKEMYFIREKSKESQ